MPDTVIAAFERTSQTHANRPALRVKRQGQWETLTWRQYGQQVLQVARGLIHLGLQPGEGVAIQGGNRPRWALSHFGSMAARGIPTGVYANNTPDQSAFIANHSEAVVVFVETEHLLRNFLENRSRLPRMRHLILMEASTPIQRY